MLGLYVHIPFCKQKCRYCDFLSFGGKPERDMAEYVSLLLTELDLLPKQGERLNSVFFGGGTPSLLPTNALPDLLKKLNANYDISGAEITAEANPGTVDGDKLFAWRKAGVNRLSLGVQSFEDGELESIGASTTQNRRRKHSAWPERRAFQTSIWT
jgi:oxygen-independent coproporphyrinogen-3 oxidase